MPEASKPVILTDSRRAMLGGAGNVAVNAAALGARVDFLCLTGQDAHRDEIISLAREYGIDASGFIGDPSRPTTIKERIQCNGDYIARLDHEKTHDMADEIKHAFLSYYEDRLKHADVLVLSDYCKGALGEDVILYLMKSAVEKNIPVLIDSKKRDWTVFKGALLAKPNLKELTERTNLKDVMSESDIEQAARTLMQKSGLGNLIASRSEQGMLLVTPGRTYSYPATARRVVEVSGVGDTVLAVCALAVAAAGELPDAVWLSNLAAGLAVEKSDTSSVCKEELRDAVLRYEKKRQSA